MPRSARIIGAAGLVLLAACGGRPQAPTGPSRASPDTTDPTAVRLEGPSSLAPGTSARYRVTVSSAGGTARDVTDQSTIVAREPWSSMPVLNVAESGLVTGGAPGEADLIAYYPAGIRTDESVTFPPGTLSSPPLRVLVLEPGTFRVSGTVTESGRPFPGVRVTVAAGRRAGLQVRTHTDGTYALYGLAGPAELAVSEEGLQPQVRSLVVNENHDVDFNLEPIPGYRSLTGDWTLTFQAAPTCRSELPVEAITRTFRATLAQRGPQLSVEFDAPSRVVLDEYPSEAFGGVSGDEVGFYLQRDPPEERSPPRWVLIEMLQPHRFLGIAGPANGRRDGNTITGTLSGYFSVYRSSGPAYLLAGTVLEASCHRKIGEHPELHSFRLERN